MTGIDTKAVKTPRIPLPRSVWTGPATRASVTVKIGDPSPKQIKAVWLCEKGDA